MGTDLRMPNITGATEREQLAQIRSYLYQFIPQLQWALNNLDTSASATYVAQQTAKGNVTSNNAVNAEATFNAIKDLIIKSADIVEAYYDEISTRLDGAYVAQSDFGAFMEKTSQEIEATSTYTNQKFSDVQAIISGEIDNLNATFSNSLGETDSRITQINGAIGEINTAVETIDGEVKTIDDHVKVVGGQVSEINTAVSNVESLTVELNDSLVDVEKSVEDTNAKVDETSEAVDNLNNIVEEAKEDISNLNTTIEGVNDDINALKVAIIEANAHIKSGLLYVDDGGFPVYGLEIGQKNYSNGVEVFNKYARFTAGRLSFYDQNGTEVAYVSDDKLFISNVEITSSYKLGGFVDMVTEGGGVVTKWVGGNA